MPRNIRDDDVFISYEVQCQGVGAGETPLESRVAGFVTSSPGRAWRKVRIGVHCNLDHPLVTRRP